MSYFTIEELIETLTETIETSMEPALWDDGELSDEEKDEMDRIVDLYDV